MEFEELGKFLLVVVLIVILIGIIIVISGRHNALFEKFLEVLRFR